MIAWELFRHYLLSRRAGSVVRSVAWLSILGVGVGVTALIVVLSVMNGFNGSIRKKLLAIEPHLVVEIPGAKQMSQVEASPIYQDLVQRKQIRVNLFEMQDVLLRTPDGLYGGAIARGIDSETLSFLLDESRKANHVGLSEEESQNEGKILANLAAGEAIMGVDLARSLGIFTGDSAVAIAPEALLLPPGEAPPFERLQIKSLLSSNIADIDSQIVFYNRKIGLAHLSQTASKQIGIEIRLPDPSDFAALQKELRDKGAIVSNWQERNSSLFFALRLEKFAIGAVLTTASLIASLSIVTVLVLLLTQKRKDIGMLMTLGLSQRRTELSFMGLGMILGFAGMGGGIVLGLLICYVLQSYPIPILPDIYYDSTLPAKVDPWLIFSVVVAAFIISSLSSWLPARSHAKLEPAEALRGQNRNQKH